MKNTVFLREREHKTNGLYVNPSLGTSHQLD